MSWSMTTWTGRRRPTAAARLSFSRFFHPDLLFGLRVTVRSGSVMADFGRRERKLRSATLKRVSCCSDTQNRNSGARGECHLVPYPSLWTRHFYLFLFDLPSSLFQARKSTSASIQAYLGHRSISNTVRYTELAPGRFKDFWQD